MLTVADGREILSVPPLLAITSPYSFAVFNILLLFFVILRCEAAMEWFQLHYAVPNKFA